MDCRHRWSADQPGIELAMKAKKRDFDIFNMSFLDVISCGFGAVVLLVLISNFSESTSSADSHRAELQLANVLRLEKLVEELSAKLDEAKEVLRGKETVTATLQSSAKYLTNNLGERHQGLEILEKSIAGLELVQSSLKRATVSQNTTKERDKEVGGIPVNSDYVLFIVDTSGSMKQIWQTVTREIENVIKIHPKVKGFQIINDNGIHLISAYEGKWIPDTPQRRKSVIELFRGWNSMSNSSPVEGLEVALKRYARKGKSLSIYIFGDDYSGSSYDPVIKSLVKLNTDRKTGRRLAKIHGIGFVSAHSTNRFPILMREVTRLNGGTFLAMPR